MELKLNKGQKKGILMATVAAFLIAGWQWRAHHAKADGIPVTTDSRQPTRAKLDLNSADTTALQAVSGIGPATARRIVRYRELIGGYTTVEQLLEVWGITPENYLRIEEQVIADTTTASFAQLRVQRPKRGGKSGHKSNESRQGRHYTSHEGNHAPAQPSKLEFAQPEDRPTASAPASSAQATSASQVSPRFHTIDLNTADSTELVSVSGIGPSTARNILKYRSIIFYFDNLDQLSEVWGIRPENLERMKPHLSVGVSRADMPHLRVNQMTVEELGRHKYLGFHDARIIVAYRDMHGPFADLAALQKVQGIDPAKWERLRGYITF